MNQTESVTDGNKIVEDFKAWSAVCNSKEDLSKLAGIINAAIAEAEAKAVEKLVESRWLVQNNDGYYRRKDGGWDSRIENGWPMGWKIASFEARLNKGSTVVPTPDNIAEFIRSRSGATPAR